LVEMRDVSEVLACGLGVISCRYTYYVKPSRAVGCVGYKSPNVLDEDKEFSVDQQEYSVFQEELGEQGVADEDEQKEDVVKIHLGKSTHYHR